jgi:general nucleoside transport system permease protein
MSAHAVVLRGRVSTGRARAFGVALLLLGAVAAWFALRVGTGDVATFQLGAEGAGAPDLRIPVRGALFVVTAACAFVGGIQLVRGFGRRTFLVLGVVIGLFVFAVLAYAARDRSLNFVDMLRSALLRAVPLTFGAMSGVLCERSGVINIAIEGMFLSAAFTGAVAGSATHGPTPAAVIGLLMFGLLGFLVGGGRPRGLLIGGVVGAGAGLGLWAALDTFPLWVGLMGGVLVGGVLGALLAVLAIRYQVDQIIGGTVINIFALGMTSFLLAGVLSRSADLNRGVHFTTLNVPVLSDVPVVGPILFRNNVFVYLMFILLAILHVALFRTRWGLRVRSVGEHPLAADTVGIRVLFERYRSVILGGMMAGLGGAYFTLGSVGQFDEGITAGRGFIALAAMIFGRWTPLGAFGAALVFGFADALEGRLGILGVGIPSEFLQMAPYLATILVVAGVVGRARPPAADGKPYVKQ